ncbi:hypothetical protein DPMN_082406 [Dreissena polymorpha]|uniref:Uncharacterized protein n=1 Tax=Dreissena polymorpha TaxID=45954 RepID=A0A9D4BGU0_DREPO|nr:hypothetical protein DPMN_082406 [Dreissena polymorpha]
MGSMWWKNKEFNVVIVSPFSEGEINMGLVTIRENKHGLLANRSMLCENGFQEIPRRQLNLTNQIQLMCQLSQE